MSNTHDIRNELDELEFKYRQLVWFAQNSGWGLDHPGKREYAENISKDYPDETDTLQCDCCGEWEDGFNNGMLAAIRFIKDSYMYGISNAYLLFPHTTAE